MRSPVLLRHTALLILPALLSVGCSNAPLPGSGGCTEIGCASAFSVNFQRQGPWPAGAYTVKVTVDGAPFSCSVSIPLSCNAPEPCGAGAPFILGLNGCALDPSQQSLSGIEVTQEKAPASIEIEVSQGSEVIGQGSFKPTYTTSQPNGPSCEPTCKSAPAAMLTLK